MSDKFPLVACFPSAEAIFSGQFKPIADIKNTCLVALDTNVLLAPYALSDEPLNQIASTYEKLAKDKRLVVPAQVAREFGKNRNSKIGELLKTVQDQMSRQNSPMSVKYSFLRNLPEYEESLKISAEIEQKQKELLKSLRKVSDAVRNWNVSDPVWDAYRKLFVGNIFELEAEAEKSIASELKFRVENSIPPGYKDDKKPDGGAGDLIIWKTLLQVGLQKKNDMVFVTLDQKSDWWTQANGSALFPRFELLEEYRAATGGCTIHLLRFSEFLSEFGVAETVVEEVQLVEDQSDELTDEEREDLKRSSSSLASFNRYLELKAEFDRIGKRLVGKSFSRNRYKSRGDMKRALEIAAEIKDMRRHRRDLEEQFISLNSGHSSIDRLSDTEIVSNWARSKITEEEEEEEEDTDKGEA